MKSFKTLVAATAGVALLGVAGCGSGSGAAGDTQGKPSTAPSRSNALAKVKPCQMLSAEELAKFGLEGPGQPENIVPDEPGCGYSGETYTAAVYKNATQTVESYRSTSDWGQYKIIEINGRKAAQAIGTGAMNADTCTTIMNAGGGVVLANVTSYGRAPVKPCVEATKIVKTMEPDLPEPT